MDRLVPPLIVAILTLPTLASGGEKVWKNIAYSDAGGERTHLDVYAPSGGKDHPVVIWVHGGAWRVGDKGRVQAKPKAFNERGYVLVSINYRLHPAVSYKEEAGDVARAIRWVHEHAMDYGGDRSRIFLMGHSAGAHLAALVAIDGRFLEKEGLRLRDLSGVILLDGAGYDIPRQIEQTPLPRLKSIYTTVFGEDESSQRQASPTTHTAKGKGIPPFLIFHVARRRDSKAQSMELAGKLSAAGVEATVIPAEGKSHMTINRELGEPGDSPTDAVFAFLRKQGERSSAK